MKNYIKIILILIISSCQKKHEKIVDENEKYEFSNIDEKSKYEIVNSVLKDHFSRHRNYTDTKLPDSTVLTYKLSPIFYDTLNQDNIIKEKIDLTKIESIRFSKLIDSIPCHDTLYLDGCSKNFLGNYSFSKIQLNEKGNKAKINIDFHCGGRCGDETNYFLYKINNSWKIKSHQGSVVY